jgi:hypothetical protein
MYDELAPVDADDEDTEEVPRAEPPPAVDAPEGESSAPVPQPRNNRVPCMGLHLF